MTLNIKDKLFKYQHNLFNIFLIISWVTYAFLVFGVFTVAPEYLIRLDYYVKIYVSLFLLYRFNPFNKIEFNELDRKIAFTSGVFLFTTSTINDLLIYYVNKYLSINKIM
jgi:hypothetical protein